MVERHASGGELAPAHVFVGPTLPAPEVRAALPNAVVHPPVAHGDLLGLDVGAGDVVVIIDGYYHQRAPVRHKEILDLLDRGTVVVGCASMGALRAAELHPYGMIGTGRVFQMYRDGEIEGDDEVAVAHLQGDAYAARNAPLVNVRHAVASAVTAGALHLDEAVGLVDTARSLHYTDRSWQLLYHTAAQQVSQRAADALRDHLREHPQDGDLKRTDAARTLADLDAIVVGGSRVPLGHWQNPHVYGWLPEFRGDRDEDGDLVSEADLLRHEQLYAPGFPRQWRDFVIAEAAAAPGIASPAGDEGAVAREVLGRVGALPGLRGPGNELLTRAERAGLDDTEVAVRTLVRCYRPPRGLHDVVHRISVPPRRAAQIRPSIRRARALNDQVLWRQRIRLVERLSTTRLRRHLEKLWQLPPGDEELLLAAARDRGLATTVEALATVRPYFLRDDSAAGGSISDKWGL
ncbi:TfuA-like protein [Rhizomonospora bruguierae]|uniref:TfuA-like protein n=1 Tax=Rhizomonospora bruguierae TaxID=1581705 RepID=UPI001BCA9658|nr:TfuA-like protein [Micromonospora sp. NBRC 107566]